MKLNATAVYQDLQPLFSEAEAELRRSGDWPTDPEEQLKHTYGSHLFLAKGASICASSPVLLRLLGYKDDGENPGQKYDLWALILFANLKPKGEGLFASEPIIRVCPSLTYIIATLRLFSERTAPHLRNECNWRRPCSVHHSKRLAIRWCSS
jgi:hypothetical protein